MTWGEFKKLVEECEGVTDDTEIDYIDIGCCNRIEACVSSGELIVN